MKETVLTKESVVCKLALAALCWISVSGCFYSRSYINQPIEQSTLDSLVPGETNARHVVEVLGAPTEVVQLGKRSAYRYDHRVEKVKALFLIVFGVRGVDINSDRVWVFFDENETLTHLSATLEAADAAYSMPVFQDPK